VAVCLLINDATAAADPHIPAVIVLYALPRAFPLAGQFDADRLAAAGVGISLFVNR
jgi:hypothetical protein